MTSNPFPLRDEESPRPIDPGGTEQQTAPDDGAGDGGEYQPEPTQERQLPPPAFPDQPHPSDPADLDEAERLKNG